MKIIGVIPARYQSSRFPGKPLADICGKPMIWWVYQQCKKVEDFDMVCVATDDDKIYNACKELDIEVVMTSDTHKTGTDRIGEDPGRPDRGESGEQQSLFCEGRLQGWGRRDDRPSARGGPQIHRFPVRQRSAAGSEGDADRIPEHPEGQRP